MEAATSACQIRAHTRWLSFAVSFCCMVSHASRLAHSAAVPAASWQGREVPHVLARLDRLVVQQAVRTPDAPALIARDRRVTYADLVRRAAALATHLRAEHIGRGALVAICLDRSIEQIVAIVGTLMSGAAYVPLDPRSPDERLSFLLKDTDAPLLITREPWSRRLASAVSRVLDVDRDLVAAFGASTDEASHRDAAAHAAATAADAPAGPLDDVAYVIYTSGSTGTPKGVLNQHDGIANHLAWMRDAYPLTTDDRVLGKTPYIFDVSVWEVFWPLSMGAPIVLADADGHKDPGHLLDLIEGHRLTVAHFVPTMLQAFLERPDLRRAASLRLVVCSGEAVTPELRDRFFARMPGPPRLLNLYGPTEAAVHVTAWESLPGETGLVPIGRPIDNVRVYITDDRLQPVGPDTDGELLLGGLQVARGYLHRPELTAERFVRDPFVDDPAARVYRTGDRVRWRADGAIDYFGRFDDQVKLGGTRVELGEIEAAFRRHADVADAAVLLRELSPGSPRLVAYLRSATGTQAAPDHLRTFVAASLPEYMVPAIFVWLDVFPTTASGKLDRRALPAPEAVNATASAPAGEAAFATDTESRLAHLWTDLLRVAQVGRGDGFVALGGDSLLALQAATQIQDQFGVEIAPTRLLDAPSVAVVGQWIDDARAAAVPPAAAPMRRLDRSRAGRPPLDRPS